jgi:hypothetical protein
MKQQNIQEGNIVASVLTVTEATVTIWQLRKRVKR